MQINLRADARLIEEATGSDLSRIASLYGKSDEWLQKQYNGEYLNFWTNTKKWMVAFGRGGLSKVELFNNDWTLFIRSLYRDLRGLSLPFPIHTEMELIGIKNRLDLILAR